jgi:putative ABC transport system permease protein
MFSNFLKVAFRNLMKRKYYSSINILGLSFGIAASVLIFLWISHETSFDKFHKDYKNIYRINSKASVGGQNFNICFAPSPMANDIKQRCPEVIMATRTSGYFDLVFEYDKKYYKEKKGIVADSNFFKIFSFPFLEGNPGNPFTDQNSIVLTRTVARKYFGNEPALGKVFLVNGADPYKVSAVIEDIPSNSQMQFSVVLYLYNENNWDNFNRLTYLLLKDNFSMDNLARSLRDLEKFVENSMANSFGMSIDQFRTAGNYINFEIQPLAAVHLNSTMYGDLEPHGNKTIILFLSIIAILILLIAGINYMNLSTAYYDNRRLEVGIRKANGATPGRLLWQFLTESLLISMAAFIVGMILIKIFLPVFRNYIGLNVNEGLYGHWYFGFLVFALVMVVGILSGLYPAAYLSRFKTIATLTNKPAKTSFSKSFSPRSLLVVFQFTITIIVIVATILIKKQVDFLLNKELGYHQEKLVVLEGANNLGTNKAVFKNELKQNPQIVNASYSDVYPGGNYSNITGYRVEGYPADQQFVLKTIMADPDYFDTYRMTIVQGRKFNTTDRPAMILNEKAVDLLKLNDPINSNIIWNNQSFPVLGVVKNFYHEPLNVTLDPMIIRWTDIQYYDYITIRIGEGNTQEALKFVEDKWNNLSGNKPFEYFFLDEKLESAYKAVMTSGNVFTAFSILSVLIACMGLFGIASFIIQRRIKEIGIRKVNGARSSEIMALLSKDFSIWVIIAFIIAAPIAWYGMNKWLESFAYKTTLSWWIFAVAGVLALAIALITVCWQSWRASSRNPVEALRNE